MRSVKVQHDWQEQTGNGITLLPDLEPVTVSLGPRFDGQGRFDYDGTIREVENKLLEAWKLSIDLRKQAQVPEGFEVFLKEVVAETQIQENPDVLGEFCLDSPALSGGTLGLALGLKMRESGYGFSLEWLPGPEGELDGAAVVEALAQAYREVYALPGGNPVFTSAQKGDLEQKAPAWAQSLLKEAGFVLPKAEVDLQSAEWVDGALRLWINLHADKTNKHALLVGLSGEGGVDLSGLDQVAAQMAQEWCASLGIASAPWLCAKLSREIEPEAREYAAWIIQEEDRIRAEFWAAMNRELEGHLQKAEELRKAAEAWRKDYDSWAKSRDRIKIQASDKADGGAGAEITVQVDDIPQEKKSSLRLIWEGLCQLPGAVAKGMDGKVGDMAKGAEFGFRAAGVVMGEAAWMVIKDVSDSVIWSVAPVLTKKLIGNGPVGDRQASYAMERIDKYITNLGRIVLARRVLREVEVAGKKATDISNKILKIKTLVYAEKQ